MKFLAYFLKSYPVLFALSCSSRGGHALRANSCKQLQVDAQQVRRHNSETSHDVGAGIRFKGNNTERMEVRDSSLKALSMILLSREPSALFHGTFANLRGRVCITPRASRRGLLHPGSSSPEQQTLEIVPRNDIPGFMAVDSRRYSASDWFHSLRTWRHSLVLRRIRSPLIFNLCMTCCICVWHFFFGDPKPGLTDRLVSLPHTLLGSALGLLLVFRTNAAYDRFWEARKQWSRLTSECRTLASHVCTFMSPNQAWPILSLIITFPFVLKKYLRSEKNLDDIKGVLCDEEFAALSHVVNQPQYVLFRLRQLSHASIAAGLTDKEREILLKSSSVLGSCVSACERIYNTPIPLAYSRHTSRFLSIYISTLPWALVSVLRWTTMPVMFVVCWALFGILEIGNLIEEPFTAVSTVDKRPLLPLNDFCNTIRTDVHTIAGYGKLAKDCEAPTFRQNLQKVNRFKVPKDPTELKEPIARRRS